MIDHVLKVTNQKQLYYIAHSQGTTIALANFAAHQELASKIKTFYALAPVVSVKHVKGVFRLMAECRTALRVRLRILLYKLWGKRIIIESVILSPLRYT